MYIPGYIVHIDLYLRSALQMSKVLNEYWLKLALFKRTAISYIIRDYQIPTDSSIVESSENEEFTLLFVALSHNLSFTAILHFDHASQSRAGSRFSGRTYKSCKDGLSRIETFIM